MNRLAVACLLGEEIQAGNTQEELLVAHSSGIALQLIGYFQ